MPESSSWATASGPTALSSQQKASTNKIKLLILLENSNNPGQIGAYSSILRAKSPQNYSFFRMFEIATRVAV